MSARKKPLKKTCESGTPLCSGELIATYGVNGSEKSKPPETFRLCGPCAAYIRQNGTKLKAVAT